MTKQIISIIAILVLFIISCEENSVGPENKNVIIAENIFLIDNKDNLNIENISENELKIAFQDGSHGISKGDILVSGEGEGFLRKVIKANVWSPNIVTITTENARLTDAIIKGSFDTTITLTFGTGRSLNNMSITESVDGVTFKENGFDLAGVSLASNIGDGNLNVEITSGSISFVPTLEHGIIIDNGKITELHVIANGNLALDFNLLVTASGAVTHSNEIMLASLSTSPTYLWVGYVPVVIVTTLEFKGGYNVSISANDNLSTGFDMSTSISIGARYEEGIWSSVWDKNLSMNDHNTDWLASGGFFVKGYVKPIVSIRLYAVAGPELNLKPYLSFNGETEIIYPWSWDLMGGIESSIAFDVSIFGYEIANYSKQLASFENLIASGHAQLPIHPSDPYPADNSENIAISGLVLSWGPTNYLQNVTFQLQLSIYSDFSVNFIDASLSVPYLTVTGLENSNTYYWRIKAINAAGESEWSEFTFMTEASTSIPSVPLLTSPPDQTTDQSKPVYFGWNSSNGAESYHLQASVDSDFNELMINHENIEGTEFIDYTLFHSSSYFWRLRAKNVIGFSEWSEIRFFTIAPNYEIPDIPVLSSPLNNSEYLEKTVELVWNTVENTDGYQIQLSRDSNFTELVEELSTEGNTVNISNLSLETGYYWRVKAMNNIGSSNWSAMWMFTVKPPSEPPPVPNIISPSNGATDQQISLLLSWETSMDATSYQLQVATDLIFSSLIINETDLLETTFDINGLSYETEYYWHVSSKNSAGFSNWTSTHIFTVKVLMPPLPPNLSSPSNGATEQNTSLTISWSETDETDGYTYQVSTSSSFYSIVKEGTETGTSVTISGLDYEQKYYWRVLSWNSSGDGDWSSVWNFTVRADVVPTPPSLSSPSNGSSNQPTSLNLSWNGVSGATSYYLMVARNSSFTQNVVSQYIYGTSFNLTGLWFETTYYWKVRGSGNWAVSHWSATWSFTTESNIPSPPSLSSPANGATDVSIPPTLSWSSSSGATTYGIQIANNSSFTNLYADQTGVYSPYSIGGLSNSTTYYWRVKAGNTSGWSNWSSSRNFTTLAPNLDPGDQGFCAENCDSSNDPFTSVVYTQSNGSACYCDIYSYSSTVYQDWCESHGGCDWINDACDSSVSECFPGMGRSLLNENKFQNIQQTRNQNIDIKEGRKKLK